MAYRPTRKEKFDKKVNQVTAQNAILQMAQLFQAPFKIRFSFCMKLLFKRAK